MRYEDSFADNTGRRTETGIVESTQGQWEERSTDMREESEKEKARRAMDGVRRISCFFILIALLVCVLNVMITIGLRHVKTGQYGVSNRIMQGRVNAQIVITGSSRALSHYDPRIIELQTGRSAFNLGRNGSQSDMQLAVLRAYLEHNQKPEMVIHNLDSFSFEATRQVYDPAQYVPYLYDEELYKPLRQFDHNIWRSRYLPLYGYVVTDMNFSWVLGLGALTGWSPREEYFEGFNPRTKKWTDEFQSFKSANPKGVYWPLDPEGERSVENLIRLCKERNIQLIFVYSPEYAEMQKLTMNRVEVFTRFHELAKRYKFPFWDYSDWTYARNTQYFQNSQHLNAEGADVFSKDLAKRLNGYFSAQSQPPAIAQPELVMSGAQTANQEGRNGVLSFADISTIQRLISGVLKRWAKFSIPDGIIACNPRPIGSGQP
jgi:hypothetical protein